MVKGAKHQEPAKGDTYRKKDNSSYIFLEILKEPAGAMIKAR